MVQITQSAHTFADRIRNAAVQAQAKNGWLTFRLVDGKTYNTEGPVDLSGDSVAFDDHDGIARIFLFAAISSVQVSEA
jgi:hypothetical protein